MSKEELLQVAKPILFNTAMVKAILEGRKTVTRRICKDGNDYTVPDMGFYDADKRTYAVHNYADAEHTDKLSIAERKCPICTGDILYVRETWVDWSCAECEAECVADNGSGHCDAPKYLYRATHETTDKGWKPSLHMPKEAARIFLKVKDVRVERLQKIDIDGIRNEGLGSMAVHAADMEIALQEWVLLWNSTIKKDDIDTYG